MVLQRCSSVSHILKSVSVSQLRLNFPLEESAPKDPGTGAARNRGVVGKKQESDEFEALKALDKVGDAAGEPHAERDPEVAGWSWKDVKNASMAWSTVVASRWGRRGGRKQKRLSTWAPHSQYMQRPTSSALLVSDSR
jgi:hypothetical protein